MTHKEQGSGDPDAPGRSALPDGDAPTIATALDSPAEPHLDARLGTGVSFMVGSEGKTRLEVYPQVVRVNLPNAKIAIWRIPAEIREEGLVYEQPNSFLSVGASGDVVFAYSPDESVENQRADSTPLPELIRPPSHQPTTTEPASPAPPPPTAKQERLKEPSERYVGRMGAVKMHTTNAGKVVAEVEITVDDPEHPGASKLVKFAAFGAMAEALRDQYQPGQLVTAVGIPHELKRKNRNGQEWTERQLYLVNLPKPR